MVNSLPPENQEIRLVPIQTTKSNITEPLPFLSGADKYALDIAARVLPKGYKIVKKGLNDE
jgi:hypothetical protein